MRKLLGHPALVGGDSDIVVDADPTREVAPRGSGIASHTADPTDFGLAYEEPELLEDHRHLVVPVRVVGGHIELPPVLHVLEMPSDSWRATTYTVRSQTGTKHPLVGRNAARLTLTLINRGTDFVRFDSEAMDSASDFPGGKLGAGESITIRSRGPLYCRANTDGTEVTVIQTFQDG